MNCYINSNCSDDQENFRPDALVAVDDTILVKGMAATAGSKMLENFYPLFDAEVVTRIKNAGYSLAGKSNVGEFGLDLLGETSFAGAVTDQRGDLAGAAALLAAQGKIAFGLNVDLNGAPRRAAALQNVAFIKPTYGTVSRYGVIPCACSAEQIGVTAPDIGTAAKALGIIAGHDEKDGTSLPMHKYEYNIADSIKHLRFGIPAEYLNNASPEMTAKVRTYADRLSAAGASVEEFSFPELDWVQPAWQILLAAETCNNLSRYDGVKFGYRCAQYENIDDLYSISRSESFGLLTKATVLYGSDVLSKNRYDACYDKALKLRRILRQKLDSLFTAYNCFLAPACSQTAYQAQQTGNSLDVVYKENYFTALPSMTGIPAVISGGVQLIADYLQEDKLLTAAACCEKMEVAQ